MKNWNKTGKIKALILALVALPNLIMPIDQRGELEFSSILIPLIFGSIGLPLTAWINRAVLGHELTKPTWNDNPLIWKRPLSFFHFGAYFFLIVGFSMLIGTGIKYQALIAVGIISISFGLGILTGIWLTLKMTRVSA